MLAVPRSMPIFMRALSVQYERGMGPPEYTEVRLPSRRAAAEAGRCGPDSKSGAVRVQFSTPGAVTGNLRV
jgi:hypothetical protein